MRSSRLTSVDFDGLQLFVAVSRSGSMAEAARELGLTPSTATRRIGALEEALGTQLLTRSTRSLNLTDAGRIILEWAQAALMALDDASDDIASITGSPSGRIRMAAPHFGANSYLPPVLASFSRAYPNIVVELTTTDDMVNLIEDRFDLVLHYGAVPASRIIGFRLLTSDRVLCAAPSYVDAYGSPQSLQELAEHHCIVHRGLDPATWTFRRDGQVYHQPIRAKIEVDNGFCIRAFTIGGAGIGRLATVSIQDDLKAGRLVPILPEYTTTDPSGDAQSLWLMYPSRLPSVRSRLLIEHLKREIPKMRSAHYTI